MTNDEKCGITIVSEPDIRFLEAFYNALDPEFGLGTFHVPHSSVFYVREALKNRTGTLFSLHEVESAMIAEGWREEVIE